VRVLIADDHPAVRVGLAAVILAEDDLLVAAQAENGEQAVTLYQEHRPDVVLMDLRMPVLDGVQAIRRITEQFPDARAVALTTYQGDADVRRALNAGARGYLLKHMLMTDVIGAIRYLIAARCVTGQMLVIDSGQRFLGLPRDVQFLGDE